MPYQHVADVAVIERVIERKRDAARIPEKTIDAFARQAFEENLRACHQFAGLGLHKLVCSVNSLKPTKKATSGI